MEDETVTAAALKTIRDLRQPPDVPKVLLDTYKTDLSAIIRKNKDKGGLAIIVGMIADGPTGVEKDLDNMERAMGEIGLAVWPLPDASDVKITGVLQVVGNYKFPSSYKFIIFYFSGHGGSLDNHSFISTAGELDDNGQFPRLFVEEGIVSPLLPKNTPQISQFVCRIFLFDSCLVDNTKKMHAPMVKKEDISVPPHGNILVAYATSMTATARADPDKGGVWTRFLSQNMVEVDLPFTTVLDLTWEDTVLHFNEVYEHELREKTMSAQGPHYTSSAGLMWLRHPDWDLTKCRDFLRNKSRPSEPSVVNQPTIDVDYPSQPPPMVSDIHPPQDLQPIANKTPKHADLMRALAEVLPMWQEIVGALGVSFPKIQSIKGNNQDDYNRMAQGLNVWLTTRCSSPTWKGLLDALSDIDQETAILKVEQRMREKYKMYISQR